MLSRICRQGGHKKGKERENGGSGNLKVDNFRVKVALKLHGELRELVAAHAGRVCARRHHIPPVRADLDLLAGRGEVQVLNQLDSPPTYMRERFYQQDTSFGEG